MEKVIRKSYSRSEKEGYVKSYYASSLSLAQYCKSINISRSAMYSWLKKHGPSPTTKDNELKSSFIPLKISKPTLPLEQKTIKLKLTNQVELELPVGADLNYVTQLISQVA